MIGPLERKTMMAMVAKDYQCPAIVTVQEGPTFWTHICGRPLHHGEKLCGYHNGKAQARRAQRKAETALAIEIMMSLGLKCRPILERRKK
jgi:hypothetical protein